MSSGNDKLIESLHRSFEDDSFIKLSLSAYRGAEQDLKKIQIRKILIKNQEKLSFTYHYKTKDIIKNYSRDQTLEKIKNLLDSDFQSATLFTLSFDLNLDHGKIRQKPPTLSETIPAQHDRTKKRLVEPGRPYLADLKITDSTGKIFDKAQDKYRQINKYIEILETLTKTIPQDKILKIVDMGSGKGYLTFALYDYLQNTRKITVRMTGVEYRADLVQLCNRIAKNSSFQNLNFTQGAIADYDAAGTNILIALHACDTATDDAIYKGIDAKAELILVAPCCHQQIRPYLEKNKRTPDLEFLMKYGIFVERQSEMVTDGMRALMLEYCGYETKIFEFISDAHTPKNIMIVGIRNDRKKLENPEILEKLKAAKDYFGIESHYLERLLNL